MADNVTASKSIKEEPISDSDEPVICDTITRAAKRSRNTYEDVDVKTEAKLDDNDASVPKIELTIKTTKEEKLLKVPEESTTNELKEKVSEEFNISTDQLCLIFSGKVLKEDESLKSLGVQDGNIIHVVTKAAKTSPNIDASPFGLNAFGGLPGLGNIGIGSPNFLELQQQMQREDRSALQNVSLKRTLTSDLPICEIDSIRHQALSLNDNCHPNQLQLDYRVALTTEAMADNIQQHLEISQDFDFEEKLISEIKKRPNLYSVRSKSYKDLVLKNNLWLQIEKETGIAVDVLKKKWKTIRDYYTRNKRKLFDGSAAKRKSIDMQRMDSLRFLEGTYILKNETLSNVQASTSSENQYDMELFAEGDNESICYEDDDTLPTDTDQCLVVIEEGNDVPFEETNQPNTSSNNQSSIRQRVSQKERFWQELQASRKERTEILKSLLKEEEDEIDLFFKYIAMTVKSFPQRLKLEAKRKIANIIFDLEEKNINN